jgi:hypothetical protein
MEAKRIGMAMLGASEAQQSKEKAFSDGNAMYGELAGNEQEMN